MDINSNNFVHFRSQSSFSILESIITPSDIINLTKKNKMQSICLTDRENLCGALEFAILCKNAKIQPIQGCIMNIFFPELSQFSEILLIAQNKLGFQNLLKLLSFCFIKNTSDTYNHITFEDLKNNHQGLILLSAYTEGIIGKMLLKKDFRTASEIAQKLKSIFTNRFYFEIMRHNSQEEIQIESQYIELANSLNIALIATNKIKFHDKEKKKIHEILTCISKGEKLSNQSSKENTANYYFKSKKEMVDLFIDLPSAIQNTVYLAQRCYFITEPTNLKFPSFVENSALESEENIIRLIAKKGLEHRLEKHKIPFQKKEAYITRLTYELDVICKMKFAGYFLIVADFVQWSKKNNISVGPGRGSGAGSIVAWSLMITDLDPIKFGLLFERFLNPERISMPDFDIDFCQEKRAEVIQYVSQKYGEDRVGQIITFGKLQAKSVIKDVSRVLGLRYEISEQISELIPFNAVSPVTLKQAVKEVHELSKLYKGEESKINQFKGNEKLIKEVLSASLELEGLNRHFSTHAAGIVISNKPILENIPIYKEPNSKMITVQYSMKYCELAGLIKFDFLGLQTLTLISKCLDQLKKRDIHIDILDIDLNDTKTYKMLSRGFSSAIFQFESIGVKNYLKNLKPDTLNDIIALGALYRPGPMENIKTYIARKHKEEEIDYIHPLIKDILIPTYGIIIYQEQVMEIAQKLANYTIASADLLRRAMGKKIKEEMLNQERQFIQGAEENGITYQKAKSIFDTIAKFAGYGFNKSHASAYGLITYQTAYLKANYTLEFMSSALNLDIHQSFKINHLINDMKNFDIEILPPCINESDQFFKIETIKTDKLKNSIRYALKAIKNMPSELADTIEKERKQNGPFLSIINFLERIDNKLLNKKALENIIKAGSFYKLHKNQRSLQDNLERLIKYSQHYHENKNSAQLNLISVNNDDIFSFGKNTKDFSSSELAYSEFDALGLFITHNPIYKYKHLLEKAKIKHSFSQEEDLQDSNYKLISGIIVKKNTRMSKTGRFITIDISDLKGTKEINIFDEKVLQESIFLIKIKNMVILRVRTANQKLMADKIFSLEEYLTKINFPSEYHVNDKSDLINCIENINSKDPIELSNSDIKVFLKVKNGFTAKIEIK